MANVHVLDEELNLPEEKQSHGLRRLAAIEAPRGSYEDAAAALTRATGVAIGKRQVEELAMRAAADVDAFYAWRRPDPAPQEQVLMLQADGKGIVMRPEGLRPAPAVARGEERPQADGRDRRRHRRHPRAPHSRGHHRPARRCPRGPPEDAGEMADRLGH
jgi:hypothetical protein